MNALTASQQNNVKSFFFSMKIPLEERQNKTKTIKTTIKCLLEESGFILGEAEATDITANPHQLEN